MASRRQGWSGVLGKAPPGDHDDDGPDDAKTELALSPTGRRRGGDPAPSVVPREGSDKHGLRLLPQKPLPAGGLKLPPPSGGARSLPPPAAADPAEGEAEVPRKGRRPKVGVAPLEKPNTGRELRGFVVTALVLAVLFGGVLLYHRSRPAPAVVEAPPAAVPNELAGPAPAAAPSPAPTEPAEGAAAPTEEAAAPAEGAAAGAPAEEAADEEEEEEAADDEEDEDALAEDEPDDEGAERSTSPMLSIVSDPPGAQVEINGIIRGQTPIVRNNPFPDASLQVRLHLPGHKPWSKTVKRSAAGHITVEAKLKSSRE